MWWVTIEFGTNRKDDYESMLINVAWQLIPTSDIPRYFPIPKDSLLLTAGVVAIILTLHHLHFFPQRHPQPLGGGMCQEVPGIFVPGISRNTVLWFLFIFLQWQTWTGITSGHGHPLKYYVQILLDLQCKCIFYIGLFKWKQKSDKCVQEKLRASLKTWN